MTDRIIDAHTHAWTNAHELPWETDGPSGADTIVYTAENVREDMELLDADRACLVATPIHGPGSPYTRRCVVEDPDTFYGILWIDYEAPDVATQVEEALEIENVLGFRFYVDEAGDPLTADLDAFWSALASFDAPQVHFLLRPAVLDAAASVVADHPEVTFVFDHIAQPTPGEHAVDESPYARMAEIAEHDNAYVKVTHTSSQDVFPFADIYPYIEFLLENYGAERLLWGSDFIYHFKQATPWETLHFLDEVPVLSTTERRQLCYRTFESMLP